MSVLAPDACERDAGRAILRVVAQGLDLGGCLS